MRRFQLINNNGRWFSGPTVELRTTEMPDIAWIGLNLGYKYESCLFSGRDSEVLARYDELSEAVDGHHELSQKLNLTNKVRV